MNKNIKDRWLSKLRSGTYGQTTGQLGVRTLDGQDSYCCLGILCEVAVEDGILKRNVSGTGSIVYSSPDGFESQTMVLPEKVVTWAGLGDENPNVDVTGFNITIDGEDREASSLSELNDYAYRSFETIADIIEDRIPSDE